MYSGVFTFLAILFFITCIVLNFIPSFRKWATGGYEWGAYRSRDLLVFYHMYKRSDDTTDPAYALACTFTGLIYIVLSAIVSVLAAGLWPLTLVVGLLFTIIYLTQKSKSK
jgi:hypothetical protein